MMGDGHVDFRALTTLVAAVGYRGDIEVEIFNAGLWDGDPFRVAHRMAQAFGEHVLS